MLLPGCGCCSACKCDAGTKLPYSLTATFSALSNRTHGNHATLLFSSDFGSGASGVLLGPGGCDNNEEDTCGTSNRGPITEVLLLDGGSGYAVLGRSAPALDISASPGSGCTFTWTLSVDDSSGASVWSLASVAVAGGSGYVEGTPLTITFQNDCCKTVQTPPAAILHTGLSREEPTVTASVNGGNGAVLPVTLSGGGSPQTWAVAAVDVTEGGNGYPFAGGEPIYMSELPVVFATTDTVTTAATATAYPEIAEPTDFSVFTTGSGVGFAATPTLSATTDAGRPCYTVAGLTVSNPGTNFEVGDAISIQAGYINPNDCGDVTYTVTEVDENGAVVTLSNATVGILFARLTDRIKSVSVATGGAYYREVDSGVPASVEVIDPGAFWCLDPGAEPQVASVTVTANGGGEGAVITPTIGSNPSNPATFGVITGLTITDPGDNYLAWHWGCTGDTALNGLPFVLRAATPTPLVTLLIESSFGCGATGVVLNKGPRVAPVITLVPVCSTDAQTACTGATLTPTLSSAFNEQDGQYWYISSVAASGGTNCIACTAAQPQGCFVQIAPANITLASSGGAVTGATVVNGGKLYSQFEWDGTPSPIYAVALTNGGSGYAKVGRKKPTGLTFNALDSSTGSGGVFIPVWTQTSDALGLPIWTIDGITVYGGEGYKTGEPLSFSVALPPPLYCLEPAAATINTAPGTTVPVSVTVTNGGKYYMEDPTIPGLPATVNVRIIQSDGSSGTSALITATVNTTVGNVNFGKITDLKVAYGGTGYTLFGGPQDCRYIGGCRIGCEPPDNVSVIARGGGQLYATVNNTHFKSADSISDCSALPATPDLWYGAESGSALIEAGGVWNSRGTEGCGNTGCACPLDDVTDLGSTPVSFTASDAAGSGTLASVAEQNNGTWTGPIEDGGYALITLSCCDSACNSSGECVLSIGVSVFLYYLFDETPNNPLGGTATIIGAACVSTLSVNEDGELVGTASVPAVKHTLEFGDEDITVELSFGTP